jgi:hypothetical protein
MSTDATLFNALITGNARKVMEELFPRRSPQQPMPGTPALVEGLSPAADTGTAGVGDLSEREHLRLQPPYERFIAELYELLSNDRFDEAHDLVRAEHRAIHGRS